jgi:ATP-binding cassette subfamily C protein CydCD
MAALLVLMPLALGDVLVGFAEAAAARPRTRAAAERLHGLEQLTPAVSDPDRPVRPTGNPRMEGRGLSFAWADREVFDDLELGLSPGERLGVVGPSGSGKSTLAGLLLRFVDPTSGRLDLGGVPLRGLALDDVRREVGLVDDDPHVFASTLRENLRLARPAATDEELQQALEDAALGRWVDSLPDGLDTWLGDGHGEISGGERARLGLARALLADAPVLVLDEPTAHLDSGTAREVVGELFAATSGRSVVWISHDGEGLDRVDRTLVLA